MPLMLLLSALAIQLFVSQLRVAHHTGTRVHNRQTLEHATLMLAADLQSAAATDLEAFSDTSFIVHAPLLHATVCGTPAARVIDVISANPSHPLRAITLGTPQTGDVAILALGDTTLAGTPAATRDSLERRYTIADITPNATACASSPLQQHGGGTPLRITLGATPLIAPELGEPLTVTRRTEWRAYRASDGESYLGRHDWNGTAWTTIQPALGPLLANAQQGFRVRVLQQNGAALAAASINARYLELHLRTPRPTSSGVSPRFDSLTALLALRGGR